MLELVAQAVAQRGSGEARTGAHDLISEFQLRPFYNLSMKCVDRNYISISTKEVPTGLPGDTSLFANPSWSLLRPPPAQPIPTASHERIAQRVRSAFRFPPGGAVLSVADKGQDVTRTFLRNVAAPAPTRPPGAAQGPASSAGTGGGAPSATTTTGGQHGVKRRAHAAAAGGGGGEGSVSEQQHSGDTTGGYSMDSRVTPSNKRQRGNY